MSLKPIICLPFGYPEEEAKLEAKWEAERMERIKEHIAVWNYAFPDDQVSLSDVLDS